MSAQIEIINMLSDYAGINKIGLLTPGTEYAMTFAGGKTIKKYLDGTEQCTMNIQLLGKGAEQLDVASQMCQICDNLSHSNPQKFPKSEEWQMRNITIGTPPSLKGANEAGMWFYAAVITANYYYKPRKD